MAVRDDREFMSLSEILKHAAKLPPDSLPAESVVIDGIIRDYWRMARPDKRALLEDYIGQCVKNHPSPEWLATHCQRAAVMASLLGIKPQEPKRKPRNRRAGAGA